MTLKQLQEAARTENWDRVDAVVTDVCDEPEYIAWASGDGLEDPDSDQEVGDIAQAYLESAGF